jgi:hypothetical protein
MIEPQIRFNDQALQLNQVLTNAGLGYNVSSPWSIWLGFTYATNAQDALGNDHEVRLWEQAVWEKQTTTYKLLSRTRLEQRKSLYFTQIANRIRERFVVSIPIKDELSSVFYDEIFFNFNRVPWITTKTLDQNRIYLGLEQEASPRFSIGIGYMNQYIFSSPARSNNIVLVSGRLKMSM